MTRLALWLLIYLPALILALPAFAWAVAVWAITRAAPRRFSRARLSTRNEN